MKTLTLLLPRIFVIWRHICDAAFLLISSNAEKIMLLFLLERHFFSSCKYQWTLEIYQ